MIIAVFKGLAIMFCISFICAFILALCKVGADESGTANSILYDDENYFKHDEPEWLRREDEENKKPL